MSYQAGSYGRSGGGRGAWRRGAFRAAQDPEPSPVDVPGPKPLGPTIDSINVQSLSIEDDAPTIKDAAYVASYNWTEGDSPVIFVPGSPPAWTPPARDAKLRPDSGNPFWDINAARYASYPLEPMVRSLLAMEPQYDLAGVDVIGCGSTFGNLLTFVKSKSRNVRFDVDVIGNTVIFVRKELSPTAVIEDVKGYSQSFAEAYTTWDPEVRNSCAHQRVINYNFGGLNILFRSGIDGYIRDPDAKAASSPTKPSTANLSLDKALGTIAVSSRSSSSRAAHDGQLQLRTQGAKVRQDQIFDIKTRAQYRPYHMEEILPRLWISQTPRFLLACHEYGRFRQPEIKDVRAAVLQWERENAALLARFHALIKRIVRVVLAAETKQCEVSWDGEGDLYITEQVEQEGRRRALPADLWDKFEAS